MDLLARREFSSRELRLRLERDFDQAAAISAELERLSAEGLLSDERFSEAFVRARRRRAQGPLRILRDLRQRGVNEELASRSVCPNDAAWSELARDWRARRHGTKPPADTRERQRQARQLQNRGFTSAQIRFALGD